MKELPEGWESIKLSNLIELCYGRGLPVRERKGGGVPVYGSNGVVGYHNSSLIDFNTIIIGRKGSVGALNYVDVPCYPIDTTYYVKMLNSDKLYLSYLLYFLHTQHLNDLDTSSTIPGLNRNNVYKIPIPLPPLPTQHRIVAILEKAEQVKGWHTEQGRLLDDYLKSVFLEMFGDPMKSNWESIELMNGCTKITDGTHDTPTRLTEGILFITGKNIRPFVINLDVVDYVSNDDHIEIYKRCNPEYHDILYTNIGVNVGTAVKNPFDFEFSMKNVALLKPIRDTINPSYLEHILNYPSVMSTM